MSSPVAAGVERIWSTLVRRYRAKGFAELFLAIFVSGASWFCLDLNGWNRNWLLLPLLISGAIVYDAIQLIVNPQYFAANDIAYRLGGATPPILKRW